MLSGCQACQPAFSNSPSNKISYTIEAVQEPQLLKQACSNQDRLMKMMETVCVRNGELKEEQQQLEQKRRHLEGVLAEQSRVMQAMNQQPPSTSHLTYASLGAQYRTPSPMLGYEEKLNYKPPEASAPSVPPSGFALLTDAKYTGPLRGVAVDDASQMIAVASGIARTVHVFDLVNKVHKTHLGAEFGSSDVLSKPLQSVEFSKLRRGLVGCPCDDGAVYLWDINTGDLVNKFDGPDGHTSEVNDISFHPAQHIMATVSNDRSCIVWDIEETKVLRTLGQQPQTSYCCTFLGHENEFMLATGCCDEHVRIFDLRTKEVVASFKEHSGQVIGLDYSSPKRLLASGSRDGTICTWDARAGWKLRPKMDINVGKNGWQTRNEVKRVAFSPNGAMIAAGSVNGKLLVHDVESGEQLASLDNHVDTVFGVAWGVEASTGHKLLVSASHDSTSKVWRVTI